MRLVQISEAAEIAGVSGQTIRNWITSGFLDVKFIGKAHYVDADTLEALGDTIQEVEATRKALENERRRLDAQRLELKTMRDNIIEGKAKLRTMLLSTTCAVYTGFFETIVELLYSYKCINKKESMVILRILNGYDMVEIGNELQLTKERVRQIAKQAIRKCKGLENIKRQLDDMWKQDAYIEELKEQLECLKQEKGMQEKAQIEQYIADNLHNDPKFLLYAKKLIDDDINLSVRALNSLNKRKGDGKEIDTLGKLASCSKSDLLKIKNLGKKTLTELDDLLERYGLQWESGIDKYYKLRREELTRQWYIEHGNVE